MIEKRRDELKPGDVFPSSHGYDLLVTEVQDTAPVRTDERHVGIRGHLHGHPDNPIRTERYEAGSTVLVYSLEEYAAKLVERAAARAEHGLKVIREDGRLSQVEMQFMSAAHGFETLAALAQWGAQFGGESYTLGGKVEVAA